MIEQDRSNHENREWIRVLWKDITTVNYYSYKPDGKSNIRPSIQDDATDVT